MDVIALHQAGFTNAVASLGTALTPGHASLIKRYVNEVYLTYDSDEAGTKAALRAMPILRNVGITAKVIRMDPYKDPDEFIKNLGTEAFEERIQKARNAFMFGLEMLERDYDLNTPEEIAEELDMPVERVREILKISQEPVSLETPIGEEEDSHLGDFIQDDNVPVPAEAAAATLLKEQLDEVLDTLTEREQKVLRLRFGMNDGRARTLEEVGKEFDVTRERIRQIEAKALRKLRHPSRSRKLRDYLE